MEIIEHAAMDASARAISAEVEAACVEEILPLASLLLSRYVRHKAEMITGISFSTQGARRTTLADDVRNRLAAIHRRIEAIKSGAGQP